MTSRILALSGMMIVASAFSAREIQKPMAPPLPPGAVARLGDPHGAVPGVSAGVLALSPDGKLLAVGSQPVTVRKADTRELVATMEMPSNLGLRILTWSSDGKWLAAVGSRGLMCWDAATGKPRWSDQPREVGRYVTAIRFVDNDRQIAIVGSANAPSFTTGDFPTTRKDLRGDDDISECCRLNYRDAATGISPDGFPSFDGKTIGGHRRGHRDAVNQAYAFCWVAVSPSGKFTAWLASRPSDEADGGSAVFVYDTATHKLLHTLTNLPRSYRIDLPDEGETVVLYPPRPPRGPVERTVTASFTVVGLTDGKTRMTGEYRYRPAIALTGYDVIDLKVFPARSAVRFQGSLITFDSLAMVRWDPQTGRKLEELPMEFFPGRHRFTMSADGKRIAVGTGMRWRVSDETLADLRESEHHLKPSVAFLPDNRLQTVAGGQKMFGQEIRVWDVRKGVVVESQRTLSWPRGIFVDWLVRTNPLGTVAAGIDHDAGGFVVYDQVKLEPLFVLKLDGVLTNDALQRKYRLTASADVQRLLLSGYQDGNLLTRWYDGGGKELARHATAQAKEEADNARWLDDAGTTFGYTLRDHRFAVVDTATMKVTAILNTSSREEWSYFPAGFGRLIVGKSGHEMVRSKIWDRSGRLLRDFTQRDGGGLSPDGRTRAIWTYVKTEKWRRVKAVEFYETATGKLRGELPMLGYADDETGLSFSPDGKLLATAAPDTSVLLWDVARPLSGKALLPVPKEPGQVKGLWEVLGDPNPAESDRALWALVEAPEHALAMLEDRLMPVPLPDAKTVQALVKRLDSGNFAERDAAQKELRRMKESTLPALRDARKGVSLEQARRLDEIIAEMQARLEARDAILASLRELRALEVLERIGTAEARKLVEAMANGADAVVTYEAQLVLARWPLPR